MNPVIPKKQLKEEIKRFLQDKDRGISILLFSELCGVSIRNLVHVFIHEKGPLTEYMQIRVSKGFKHWQEGRVAVMQNRDNTRFVQYRKEAKPRLTKTTGLQVVDGQIKLKIGIANRADYSKPTLDEQLRRG